MRRGREIGATVLIAFGLFSLLSVYFDLTGQAGAFIAARLDGWLGFGAGAPGLLLAWLGIVLWRRPLDWRSARRFVGCVALLTAALTMLHVAGRVFGTPSLGIVRSEIVWGGQLGRLFADFAIELLGPVGTTLAVIVLCVVGWVLLVDVPPTRLFAGWKSRLSRNTDDDEASNDDDEQSNDGFFARWRARRRTVQEAATETAATVETETKDPARAGRRSRRSRRADHRDDSTVSITTFAIDDGSKEFDAAPTPSNSVPEGQPAFEDAQDADEEPHISPPERKRGSGNYVMPQTRLLERPKPARRTKTKEADDGRAALLEDTLASFGIDGRVVSVSRGPTVTRYEVQPPPGVKVSRIVGLADDIALALAATGVRIEAPVPGKSVVGIEVPNKDTSPVVLREILESDEFQTSTSRLTIGLGRDIAGKPLVADLQKLLHLLIAGATGSGKSVCLNSIITSLLYKADPDEVKMMMIDPKRVELSVYDGIPHLITPVVTDPKEAAGALRWAVKEMERRYQLLAKTGVRNLDAYNRRRRKPEGLDEFVPYLVVIIDELADLMMVASADVENSIVRLAQMARAAGIYLIIATQRPSVDVITGLIKANVPSRLAFAVSSQVDSRTILDMGGAERLLGRGDMLFHPIGAPKPVRAQGAWVSDTEVESVAEAWRAQAEPEYIEEVIETPPTEAADDDDVQDELFDDAVALVREQGHASVSMLQRRFRIGYARAARLIDVMEVQGIVGPYQGSKPREVIGIDGAIG